MRLSSPLPLATLGIQRYVWESRFGPMLIEVRQGRAYVNEEAVEPADPPAPPSPTALR